MNRHLDVMKIKEAEFAKSSWRLDGKPSGGLPEFAFIGRSNSELVNLFVLVDCRHEPQKIDLAFIEALGERGIPFSLVFTKAPVLSRISSGFRIIILTVLIAGIAALVRPVNDESAPSDGEEVTADAS